MEKKYECPFLHSGFDIAWNDKIRACCAVSIKNAELDLCSLKNLTEENISTYVGDLMGALKKFHENFYCGNIPDTCKKCNLLNPLAISHSYSNKWLGKIDCITIKHYKECNLRCYYCDFAIDKEYHPTETRKITLLLDYILTNNLVTDSFFVCLSGGEPSISKHAKELIRYCSLNNIRMTISTNGTNYLDSITDGINSGLFSVEISPDAGSAEVYKIMKGKDYFVSVWENINKYESQTNSQVQVKFILDTYNIGDIPNMIEMCVKNKVQRCCLSFNAFIPKEKYLEFKNPVDEFISLCYKNNLSLVFNPNLPSILYENNEIYKEHYNPFKIFADLYYQSLPKGCNSISIYGYGSLGKYLKNYFSSKKISVNHVYVTSVQDGIDKNSEALTEFSDNNVEENEVIIIATLSFRDSVVANIRSKTNKKVVIIEPPLTSFY